MNNQNSVKLANFSFILEPFWFANDTIFFVVVITVEIIDIFQIFLENKYFNNFS